MALALGLEEITQEQNVDRELQVAKKGGLWSPKERRKEKEFLLSPPPAPIKPWKTYTEEPSERRTMETYV